MGDCAWDGPEPAQDGPLRHGYEEGRSLPRRVRGDQGACLYSPRRGGCQEGVRQGDRQERPCQDRWHWDQAAEREHRRVEAVLRDHGRRSAGLPQVKDHGQHSQVLLHDRLHWLHQRDGSLAISTATDEDKAKHGLAGGKISPPGDQLKLAKTFVADGGARQPEDHRRGGQGQAPVGGDIPASALINLESLASSDFKANLGKIIHDIYQTAHTMFSDMPQGDHKKRAKYRFASKTLMRILPTSLKSEVEGLIEKKAITLDLYEILGQRTWGQKAAEK